MTPLLGRTLILCALLFSTAGCVISFAAGRSRSDLLERWSRASAFGYAILMILANLLMIYALLTHDFSVSYVAQVGSRSLPVWVSIVSLWSSLEGSILFWGLVLGGYIAGALLLIPRRFSEYTTYATGVWLATASFFSFLIAGPAQPFLTIAKPLLDGPGPNPLLQNHILMAIHPPFLYLGYVGMVIPFGLASAALLRGKIGDAFVAPLRSSLLLPWTFLTVAVVLGGWWAYEVLGWGGYWAWDPVENASLLPWLTATAALHSAIVMERKRILKGWTLTLILSSFLLTILGTFMTRSGVFNSVHSFTQSSIGPTILVFLAIALVWSVILLALRIDRLSAEGTIAHPVSREGAFLANNLFLVVLTFTVLIGTIFPLIVEAVNGVQMSVGRPYFDRMAVPIGVVLLFLMGIGPALPWGRPSRTQLIRGLVTPLFGALLLLFLGIGFGVRNAWTLLTLFCGGYTLQVTLQQISLPARRRMNSGKESFVDALAASSIQRGQRRFGAYIVHAGAVLLFIAIAVSSTMGTSKEVQLKRGQSTTLGPYTLTLLEAVEREEPHRKATIARIRVQDGTRELGVMEPRMNIYERQREPIGTPDVKSRFTHDLYLSLMNIDPIAQTAGLHIMINPMIVWIWIATALMGIGGLAALIAQKRTAGNTEASDTEDPEVTPLVADSRNAGQQDLV